MAIAGSKQYLEVDLQAETAFGPQASDNNIFAEGESVFATINGSPLWRGVPIVEDGFGIAPTAQRAGESLKRNVAAQAPPNLTGFDVSGALNPIAAPFDKSSSYNRSLLAWLLGAAINKESESLRSYSMRWITPNVAQQLFLGCKCQSLTVEASEDSGTVAFNSEWVAASMAPTADGGGGTPVFPAAGAKTNTPGTGLNAQGWTYSRAIIYKATQSATQASTVLTPIATARSVSVTMNNNLSPKAARVKTELTGSPACPVDTFVITEIREGQQEISGTMIIDYVDESEWSALNNDTILTVGLIARHPQSSVFGVVSMSPTGPTWDDTEDPLNFVISTLDGTYCTLAPASEADDDYLLMANGALMVERQPAGAAVTAFEQDVFSISGGLDVADDQIDLDTTREYWDHMGTSFGTVTVAEYVLYDACFGIRVSGVKLDSANLTGGPADIIGQELNFTAGQFGDEASAFTWITPAGLA